MKEINYQILKKANSGDQEAINFIKSRTLPDDFDWKFYAASNKNISNLKLDEINSICHYLNNGKRKNLEYSRKNTSKWVIPEDFDKIIELQKITDCYFSGSFADFLHLEPDLSDLYVFKDMDIVCDRIPINVDLQINKSHHEETQKFLDIQPCAPSSFYSGNYKNKIIDVFINYYEKQDPKVSMEFLINGQKIKIITIEYRIKTLQLILDNQRFLANSEETWLAEKLRTIPEKLHKLKQIKN